MMRSLSKSMVLFAFLLAFGLHADVIVPGTHSVGVCVKIANLNEFPISVVRAVSGPGGGGSLTGDLFKPDSCKGSVYWACTVKLFWTSKSFFDSVGIQGILSSSTVKDAFPHVVSKKSVNLSQVHLLCDTIRFNRGSVPDSNSLQSEDHIYTIVKSGDSYGIYLSELVSYYKGGSSSKVTFAPSRVIVPELRTTPDGTPFSVTWEKGCVNIASSKPTKASVKIIDVRGRNVMSLNYNFSAGELVRRSLNSLSPGVYCISLTSTEGRVIRTFSVFEAGSWGR
jgi:hypothetical protein